MSAQAVADTVQKAASVITLKDVIFNYSNLVHAIAGMCGSSIAISAFYPLDTVRLRLQVDDKRKARHPLVVIQEIFKEEGLEGLYRGWLPMVQSICCSNFIYFYTYNSLKAVVYRGKVRPTALKDLSLAFVAGVVNVLTTTPLWVANTRMKLQGIKWRTGGHEKDSKKYKNVFDCMQKIVKEEGIEGLWRGTVSSLFLVSNPSIQWTVYEYLKRVVAKLARGKTLSGFAYFIMGAMAKVIATMFTYPLQIVQAKRRAGPSTEGSQQGMWETLENIARTQGLKGLYKGLETKLTQTVLMAALMYLSYEKIAAFVFMLLGQSYPPKKV